MSLVQHLSSFIRACCSCRRVAMTLRGKKKPPGLQYHMLTCTNSPPAVSTPSRPSHMVNTIRHRTKATVRYHDNL